MAQRAAYYCDQCDVLIGNKPHLSLSFNVYSGLAIPPGTETKTVPKHEKAWRVVGDIKNTFRHFCNDTCLQRFFAKLIKDELYPTKPKKR